MIEYPNQPASIHVVPWNYCFNTADGNPMYYRYASNTQGGYPSWPNIAPNPNVSSYQKQVEITLMQNMQLTGMNLDIVATSPAIQQFWDWQTAALQMNTGFHVEPCLDFTGMTPTVDGAVSLIKTLLVGQTANWGTLHGKACVWVYQGCSWGLPFWQAVQKALPKIQLFVDDLSITQHPSSLGCSGDGKTWANSGIFPYSFAPRTSTIDVHGDSRIFDVQTGAISGGSPGIGGNQDAYWKQNVKNGIVSNDVTDSNCYQNFDLRETKWNAMGVKIKQYSTLNDFDGTNFCPDCSHGFEKGNHLAQALKVWRT